MAKNGENQQFEGFLYYTHYQNLPEMLTRISLQSKAAKPIGNPRCLNSGFVILFIRENTNFLYQPYYSAFLSFCYLCAKITD